MSVFSRIKARASSACIKSKVIATGFIIAIASVAAVATLGNAGAAPVSTPNCDANSVVWCGGSSVSQLQGRYTSGDGHNSATSIHNIYTWFGISSSSVSAMSSESVKGYVTKTGDVYATINGQNTLVATGALTAGRQNISGSTKVTSGGTTFYTRKPSVSFLDSELSAMVSMKNGVFQFAILNSCGNPVKATPKKPSYSVLKQVRAGTSGSYASNVTVKSGSTVSYQITVSSTGALPVNNVTVHDTLPAGITYTSGTLQENGSAVSAANASKFFSAGLLVGSIKNGSKEVFTFTAKAGAVSDTATSCKAAVLDNEGFISAPGLSNEQSGAKVSITCTPPPAASLVCNGLTLTPGDVNASNGNQAYTLDAKATPTNATITGYTFTFGDGATQAVASSSNTASTTHTYAPGTYTASVSVAGTGNGKTLTATAPACQQQITVKKPAPSTLACVDLTLTPGTAAANGDTPYTLKATASASNATITKYVFTPGDNSADITVNSGATSVSTTHTYAPGTFTASVAVSGTDAAGKPLTAVANPKCSGTVTVKISECKPGVPVGSPACSPSSLACVALGEVLGDTDASTGATGYTFTATASADNATITGYSFDFGDKSQPMVVTTGNTTATATHTFAPGTYTVAVTVSGKDASGNPIQAPVSAKCSVPITVKTPECKPGVPAGKSDCFVYTCNAFTLTIDNDTRTVTVASFDASSTNPAAVLAHVSIDWGDGANSLIPGTAAVGQTHTFTVDQSTVKATAQFTTPDQTTPVSSTTCMQPVNFTTPLPPSLPNTGAGNVIGIFAGVVITGTLGFRLFLSRKLARR